MDQSTFVHLVTAALAVIILIDVSVLWVTGKQVPDLLAHLVVAVFITYFASGLTRSRIRGGSGGSGSGGSEVPTRTRDSK